MPVQCPQCAGTGRLGELRCYVCTNGKTTERKASTLRGVCHHNFVHVNSTSRCMHTYRCTKCSEEAHIDSSD